MNFKMPGLAILLALSAGCAHGVYRFPGPIGTVGQDASPRAQPTEDTAQAKRDTPKKKSARRSAGQQVGKAAERYLGATRLVCNGTSYRYDCSGLVMAAHARAGLPIEGNTAAFFEQAKSEGVLHKRKTPRVGDLAFFDNTHDRNGNGRLDDRLTHVAVVTAVDSAGTITMVHKSGKGVVELRMNLRSPDVHTSTDGAVYNDYLRRRSSRDSARTRYLAGELWVGFASLWEVSSPIVARVD